MIERLVPASRRKREKFTHEQERRRKEGEDPFLAMYWAHESYRNGEDPTFGNE
jgi:hypothetical protein